MNIVIDKSACESMWEVGKLYQEINTDNVYILATVDTVGMGGAGNPLYALIDLSDGNRWTKPVSDITRVAGSSEQDFEKLPVGTKVVLTHS